MWKSYDELREKISLVERDTVVVSKKKLFEMVESAFEFGREEGEDFGFRNAMKEDRPDEDDYYDEEELNDARRNGYDDGYNDGHSAGYDEGHDTGYSEGYDVGHRDGYDQRESELESEE